MSNFACMNVMPKTHTMFTIFMEPIVPYILPVPRDSITTLELNLRWEFFQQIYLDTNFFHARSREFSHRHVNGERRSDHTSNREQTLLIKQK